MYEIQGHACHPPCRGTFTSRVGAAADNPPSPRTTLTRDKTAGQDFSSEVHRLLVRVDYGTADSIAADGFSVGPSGMRCTSAAGMSTADDAEYPS